VTPTWLGPGSQGRRPLRVLRVYHAGRDPAHRERERSLQASGVDVTLVVPSSWPEGGSEAVLSKEGFPIVELPVARSTDVNRHKYLRTDQLEALIQETEPDLLDIHEEPFSAAARQWLAAAPHDLPVVMYTAQNVDKRFPPPFAQYERAAHRRVAALSPCSAQAASVARGKGFDGLIDVLPLGYDATIFEPGTQSLEDEVIVLALFGRLVLEKGISDAVRILARLNAERPARLILVGNGPEESEARALAATLGVTDQLEIEPWQPAAGVAATYRKTHIVLVPSRPTETWVEQFGRVIVEAQASGAVVAGYASGSIPEVAGEAAALTGVGEVEELGAQIARIATHPADFARRRDQGIMLSKGRTWARVAERHAAVYETVVAGDQPRLKLPRSPKKRRAAARAEFGPTASTTAGPRPFALPFLRSGGAAPSAFAAILDAATELAARLRRNRKIRP
jgi:glycosyltransferase involved in cell wall biosynthesis